jgi:DNA-binding CsgD family transcriptional regulator
VAGYKAGASVYELGRQFQIHRDTVASILERRGVARRGRPLSLAQAEEAVQLYRGGQSLAKIAPKLGCHPSTVRLALLGAGEKLRDPHGKEK